jgi:hypothetical protein
MKVQNTFVAWNQIWLRSSQMNPEHDWREASTGTDIGNRRLRFLATRKYQKIHDCDTLWYQQSNFTNGGAAGSSGTGGMEEKNQEYFSTMPGTNTP